MACGLVLDPTAARDDDIASPGPDAGVLAGKRIGFRLDRMWRAWDWITDIRARALAAQDGIQMMGGHMRKFDQETALSAIELQQLAADWSYELDVKDGLNLTGLLTEDCSYAVGANIFRGHAAVKKFYTDRLERIRTQQKDGVRTQRHTITNLRISFQDRNHATLGFVVVNYSAGGKAPVTDMAGPTAIADGRMECRRDADNQWRIAAFASELVFAGNDPFLNATVAKT